MLSPSEQLIQASQVLHESGFEPGFMPGAIEIMDVGYLMPCDIIGGFELQSYHRAAILHFEDVGQVLMYLTIT